MMEEKEGLCSWSAAPNRKMVSGGFGKPGAASLETREKGRGTER